MIGHVDDTAGALSAESKRANEVKEAAAGCAMYICVAVEFLVLMILIVFAAMWANEELMQIEMVLFIFYYYYYSNNYYLY